MEHIGKLILRLTMGGLMLTHGIPKLKMLFSGGEIQFPDPLGIGPTASLVLTVFAEFLCAALIVIGFKTKWATIPLFITMIVAGLIFHWSDPWSKKELAIIYALGYLTIYLIGPGKYSIDGKNTSFNIGGRLQ